MDWAWGYYTKWNKSSWERQILYVACLYVKSKQLKSQKQAVEWWLPGVGDEGNGKMLVKGYKTQKNWK